MQNWNYDKPGASINVLSFIEAATTIRTSAKDRCFESDVNSIQEANAVAWSCGTLT